MRSLEGGRVMSQGKPRVLAIHLPQFHPIPENDEWWGPGFTEWTNVAKAKPLFPGHDQPRVPADLGFYDLRLPEAREAQAKLAREHGIGGFCYYHYWFNGRRLLDRPVRDILHSQRPDFPFCLFWANETWSRRWLGEERDVLMEQTYSEADNISHARYLASVFQDHRYIRLGNRPLFIIYRPTHMTLLSHFVARLREQAQLAGAGDPLLLGCSAHAEGTDMRTLGLDGTLDFQPKLGFLPGAFEEGADPARRQRNRASGVDADTPRVYSTAQHRQEIARFRNSLPHPVYPSVFVSWDSTPRRGENGIVLEPRSAVSFAEGLRDAANYLDQRGGELAEPVLFVNAWNEWAEGNHLEPDNFHGRSFLEALDPKSHPDSASAANPPTGIFLQREGWCPICEKEVTFSSKQAWLRDHYLCSGCGSIPRERALMHVIQTRYPNWRELRIHEGSPGHRGASVKLREQCKHYTATQYDPKLDFGKTHPTLGYRSEDLEKQTFADEEFDLVITQDVMEHIFDAQAAFREIHRTLKPGGAHIFTTPLVNKDKPSQRRAERKPDGTVAHLFPPDYHGNPMSSQGSLVTWHWGADIVDAMTKTCDCRAELVPSRDPAMGIEGEYLEVLVQNNA